MSWNNWDYQDDYEDYNPPEPEYSYDDYKYDQWKCNRDEGLAPTVTEILDKGWKESFDEYKYGRSS